MNDANDTIETTTPSITIGAALDAITDNGPEMPYFPREDVRNMQRALGKASTVLRSLGHRNSVRARQRAIAFYLAHTSWNGFIRAEELRNWCKLLGAYNRANFAQNMTKEAKRGLVTGNIRTTGGWRLTFKGEDYARELANSIDSMTAEIASAVSTISVKAKVKACALCADTCDAGEHVHDCAHCGLVVHHECNEEMRGSATHCPSGLCPGHGRRYDDVRPVALVARNAPTVYGPIQEHHHAAERVA